ncbi:hypothetical protein Calab_3501 [Caldithrix abyssi DSM 13497]|uniref:Uncharacterized protein n=1 Tax=Caldithrix abyssi DSM 13497 TaxID=880073 RepID=H1XXH6_CALAY|nr:hypothetical protein [Caldithrix abyssi]APF19183.1 hypothetical protein Cabys_2434 [Caldithrix abyssi DSM 13497]EHO43100.1 hypothetical protein Calab_3501 [Caldithrix abyssi DSM 13497]
MENFDIKCLCQLRKNIEINEAVEKLSIIRQKCSALQKVLLPDDVWGILSQLSKSGVGKSRHLPLSLNALSQGSLYKITTPIHRYLLKGNELREDVSPNYIADLKENWLLKDNQFRQNEKRRHQRSKHYMGKLCELLCACWLESLGWKIVNLGALGGAYDIEAHSTIAKKYAIEVKYIGIEDEMFNSFSDGRARCYDENDIVKFVLCKSYNAAKQLKNYNWQRLIILVIDDIAWPRIKCSVFDEGVNGSYYKEYPKSEFFKEFKNKYPKIESKLIKSIDKVNDCWIIRMNGDFSLKKEYIIFNAL